MYSYDVVQIVDTYRSYYDGRRQTMKFDPDAEAQSLSMLAKALGRNDRKIAIIAQGDEQRLNAYQRAGYETHTMNGNRAEDLRQFIIKMKAQVKHTPPHHVILVSDDPEFVHLCDSVTPPSRLAVWTNSSTPPRELTDPSYGWRPLEELLPNLKISRIDVRIDLENIFIGLRQRGWQPNLRELIEAIRQAMESHGEIVTITGYADFDELSRHDGPNINLQRELTLAGGESRYVVNQRGKNTADMKIADDIRTLVEHDPGTGGAIDIIAIATMDRDFRHIVDTAKARGKKVFVLALEGGLSRELEGVASGVYYLDRFLNLTLPNKQEAENEAPPQREDVAFMMRIAALMHRNRWRFVYRDRLEQEFGESSGRLHKLIANGWLSPSPNGSVDAQGHARTLEVNPNNTTAQAAHYLARWIPARLDFCLTRKGMPHVDSHYMAYGMTGDSTLSRLGVGQTRLAAENWLYAAASAGLVVATEQPHPKNPSKLITTWGLPEKEAASSQEADETVNETAVAMPSPPAKNSSHLRQLLTHGLSDSELTRLLFDYFLPVHREFEGTPKVTRIQAVIDYVELRNQHDELLAAIREVNPALGDEPEVRLRAA